MLFYSPEDPPLMPMEAEKALHLSQLAPAGVLVLATVARIASGRGGLPPWLASLGIVLLGIALAYSVAVPMWCGARYDQSVRSHTAGALRALGIWCWFQGFVLALSLLVCGLILDRCGVWPDRLLDPPAGPRSVPMGPMI